MRTRSLTRGLLAPLACTLLIAGASALNAQIDPLAPDRVALRFGDAKLFKTYQFATTTEGTKFSEGFEYAPGQFGAVVESKSDQAFGIVQTPIVGSGEYSVDLELGFLGLEGIVASGALDGPGATQAGIEVDRFGSDPLDFYFLGIFWAQNQLWAYAAGSGGQIGNALALGPTLWATLRVVQTASALQFYARAYKAASFALVASLAISPWNDLFRFGFGASNLGRGGRVAFSSLLAIGALFDPAALPFLLTLADQFYTDFANIHCALLFEPNLPLALALLGGMLPQIDSMRSSIENLGRAGTFVELVLWSAAVKFLAKAYSSGMKAHTSLSRNDILKSLPALFLMFTYLQLADLSLRGFAVRKAEDVGFFPNFEPA